jgi:hypothetical protein
MYLHTFAFELLDMEIPPSESSPEPSFNINSKSDERIVHYKRKIDALRQENKKIKTENSTLKEGLDSFLNDDQKLSLGRQSMRGTKWSNETMMKAYKIRLACGSTGYEVVKELGQPLPSQRTLQRRIEHLKFSPGLLQEVLNVMKVKVNTMVEEERRCVILIDEMAITPKLDFDPSTGLVLGKPTIPSSNKIFEEVATHGLVYMLAGVTSRWKQVVGYQFTGKSFDAGFLREDIENIISKDSLIQNSAPHPLDPTRKLYFNPDAPHILKNLRNHLTNGQKITISDEFVKKNALPTNIVDIEYIKALIKIDCKDLKLAPFLNESCAKPSHFEKMKVGLAVRLLNHDTGAALRYCVKRNLLNPNAVTTARFCETIFRWFKLVTSRSRSLALSTKISEKYMDAINFLKDVIKLFEQLKIGTQKIWKPVQTGVLLATTNAIELADIYLKEKNFHYVCLGRFTQDALENLFSNIRYINPVPSSKFFKMAIRIILVAQFFKPNNRGNYEIDDSEYFANFLNTTLIDEIEIDTSSLNEDFVEDLNIDEIQSLYYLTGRTIGTSNYQE